MIKVIDAGALQGYSGTDHLIDDSEIKDIIGREYRSVKQALDAADKRCFIVSHGSNPRRNHPYTWVKVMMANGEIIERNSVN